MDAIDATRDKAAAAVADAAIAKVRNAPPPRTPSRPDWHAEFEKSLARAPMLRRRTRGGL